MTTPPPNFVLWGRTTSSTSGMGYMAGMYGRRNFPTPIWEHRLASYPMTGRRYLNCRWTTHLFLCPCPYFDFFPCLSLRRDFYRAANWCCWAWARWVSACCRGAWMSGPHTHRPPPTHHFFPQLPMHLFWTIATIFGALWPREVVVARLSIRTFPCTTIVARRRPPEKLCPKSLAH